MIKNRSNISVPIIGMEASISQPCQTIEIIPGSFLNQIVMKPVKVNVININNIFNI